MSGIPAPTGGGVGRASASRKAAAAGQHRAAGSSLGTVVVNATDKAILEEAQKIKRELTAAGVEEPLPGSLPGSALFEEALAVPRSPRRRAVLSPERLAARDTRRRLLNQRMLATRALEAGDGVSSLGGSEYSSFSGVSASRGNERRWASGMAVAKPPATPVDGWAEPVPSSGSGLPPDSGAGSGSRADSELHPDLYETMSEVDVLISLTGSEPTPARRRPHSNIPDADADSSDEYDAGSVSASSISDLDSDDEGGKHLEQVQMRPTDDVCNLCHQGPARLALARAWWEWSHDLEPDNPQVVDAAVTLGNALASEGMYDEAEPLLREALDVDEQEFGSDHFNTLASADSLCGVLEAQGKYAEAESITRETARVRSEKFGAEHPETLTSMHNLGLLLDSQGLHGEAEPIIRSALEGRGRALGLEDIKTLEAALNLTTTLYSLGRFSDAEVMGRVVLKSLRSATGERDVRTLAAANNVALAVQAQGRLREAEMLHREVLKVRSRTLGDDHAMTLASAMNLATCLQQQGNHDLGSEVAERTLEAQARALGKAHCDTLSSTMNVALDKQRKGDYRGAEKLLREVLESDIELLGPEHPATLVAFRNLAMVMKDQGDEDRARGVLTDVFNSQSRILGVEHPSTAETRKLLQRFKLDGAAEVIKRLALEAKAEAKAGVARENTSKSCAVM